MEKEKLKQFALDEFRKKYPQPATKSPAEETAQDEKASHECTSTNINEPLLDTLVNEFCQNNPEEFAVLNVFSVSDEKLKEIQENIETAIADGTIERITYEQIINHAGLAYQQHVMNGYAADIDNAISERQLRD
jgi:hypothetical protein